MNATDSVRVLGRFDAGLFDAALVDGVASQRFESALPVRSFFAWPSKRNYEGAWWSSTVRAHVGFESLLERDFLMFADHDREVAGIASQPFALLWPKGTEGVRGHVPDFFLRLGDGTGRVVDVRHPDRLASAERQFALTREACEAIGWEYEVFTGLVEPFASNLRWLAGYRLDRFAPPASAVTAMVEAFSPSASLAAGALRAARVLKLDSSVVQAYAMHLMFTGVLDADLSRPLSLEAIVSTAREAAEGAAREAAS